MLSADNYLAFLELTEYYDCLSLIQWLWTKYSPTQQRELIELCKNKNIDLSKFTLPLKELLTPPPITFFTNEDGSTKRSLEVPDSDRPTKVHAYSPEINSQTLDIDLFDGESIDIEIINDFRSQNVELELFENFSLLGMKRPRETELDEFDEELGDYSLSPTQY